MRLKSREKTGAAVRRIVRRHLGAAIDSLAATIGDQRVEAIHEARTRCKKVRALVALVRDAIGPETCRREERAVAEAAGKLGSVRDAHVLLATLQTIEQDSGAQFPRVHALLEQRLADAESAVLAAEPVVEEVAEALREVRRRVAHWSLSDGFDAIAGGLRRTYRNARRAMRACLESPVPEHFHEWRKPVKSLRYQCDLLLFVWPSAMRLLVRELNHLGDLLGEDHDLAVLEATVREAPELADAAPEVDALVVLAEVRRQTLEAQALPIGRRLFAESPRSFVRRLESWWKVC